MVNIHIALVGKDTGNIINGIQIRGGRELYPVTSEKYQEESVPRIREALPAVKVHSSIGDRSLVVDPFREDSFITIVGLIIEIVQARQGEGAEILINITGGTNLMSAAAVTAAMLTETGAYYVNKHPDEEQYESSIVDLPLIMDSVKLLKNEKRRRIMQVLDDGKERTNDSLASTLKVNKKSISKLLQDLEGKGLVTSRKEGKEKLNSLTDEGRIAIKVIQ